MKELIRSLICLSKTLKEPDFERVLLDMCANAFLENRELNVTDIIGIAAQVQLMNEKVFEAMHEVPEDLHDDDLDF